MRKSSGLRHRFRNGSNSTYKGRKVRNGADRYGEYLNGRCIREGTVGGRQFDPLAEAQKHKDSQW